MIVQKKILIYNACMQVNSRISKMANLKNKNN